MADENTSNTSEDESSDSGLGAFSGFHTQEQSEVRNNGDLPHRSRDQQEIEDRNFFAPNSIASISAIIAALVSFISSMIIIPTKITEYLFNVNETTQFGDIIKNIQEYDKAVREDLYKNK